MGYQLQVITDESNGRWIPAIHGELNQTGESDAAASTFATEVAALRAAEEECVTALIESTYVLEWRVEEVDESGTDNAYCPGCGRLICLGPAPARAVRCGCCGAIVPCDVGQAAEAAEAAGEEE